MTTIASANLFAAMAMVTLRLFFPMAASRVVQNIQTMTAPNMAHRLPSMKITLADMATSPPHRP